MKVVLADIDEKALAKVEQELKDAGASLLAVRMDVSKPDDVEALAQKTLDAFGAVHLLFNNAGVASVTTLWEASLADWQWVMGVNLWGVIHGVRTFVPIMLKEDVECHVVNTASMAGLISGPCLGIYKVTKHGVVALSEVLACELALIDAKVKVSVLCPAWVNTKIADSERNRPCELQDAFESKTTHPTTLQLKEALQQFVEGGIPSSEVASAVFDAIRKERFYILTHADWKPLLQKRMEDILQEHNPQSILRTGPGSDEAPIEAVGRARN